MSEEAAFIARSLDRFGGREARRRREAAERDELIQSAELGRRIKSEMDEEAAVAGHVTRSRRMINEMFEQGSGVLASMAGSRERIKVRCRGGLVTEGTVCCVWLHMCDVMSRETAVQYHASHHTRNTHAIRPRARRKPRRRCWTSSTLSAWASRC